MHAFYNDEHFFETAREAGGINADVLKRISRAGRGHLADWHAFREDAVITGSVEPLT